MFFVSFQCIQSAIPVAEPANANAKDISPLFVLFFNCTNGMKIKLKKKYESAKRKMKLIR